MQKTLIREPEQRETPVTKSRPQPVNLERPDDYDDGLLAIAAPIMAGSYAAAFAIAAFTFFRSGAALFALAICLVYSAMYFGVPYVMARIRNAHDRRWQAQTPMRTADRIEIYGGTIRRHEALLQMVIVPVLVAFAFGAFSVIWLLTGPSGGLR